MPRRVRAGRSLSPATRDPGRTGPGGQKANGHDAEPPPTCEDDYGTSSASSSSGADSIEAIAARLRKNLGRKVGETTEYVDAEVKTDTELQRLALATFNPRFALFKPGASDVVIDKSKPALDLIKIPDFLRRYSRIIVMYKQNTVLLARVWLSIPGAQRVEKVVLHPNEGILKDSTLWNMAGSFVAPKRGAEPPLFFQLVRDAFRQADGEWLLDWVADMVQNPQVKPDTVPAINGKAGCGKTRFWRYIGRMLGDGLYYEMSGLAGIGNKFNADTESALLIFVDEAEAKDLGSSLPLFKTLATGSTRRIERKGIDPFAIPNITRLAMAGEHKPALLSDGGMRRRVPLFEMLPVFKGNLQFWIDYDAEMKGDGPPRLLAHLLDRKITHRLHEAPITEIGRETAREHLEPLYLWLVGIVESFARWHDHPSLRQVAIAELMIELHEWMKLNHPRWRSPEREPRRGRSQTSRRDLHLQAGSHHPRRAAGANGDLDPASCGRHGGHPVGRAWGQC